MHPERRDAIKEFDNKLLTLPQFLEDPDAIVEKLKDIETALPHFCREMGLDDRQASAVMDEFTFFLFNVSEIHWITDESKRKIIGFQAVIRRYKEKINTANWEPETAKIIDDLVRYAQGFDNALPPIIRYGRLPDIFELLSKVPFMHRWYDHFLIMKKRELVARLLPRVAMLPLRHIYWLEGNEIKSVDRASVESDNRRIQPRVSVGKDCYQDPSNRFKLWLPPFRIIHCTRLHPAPELPLREKACKCSVLAVRRGGT